MTHRHVLSITQPPIQWVPAFFDRVKWLEYVGNHSPPSTAKVKNKWNYTSTPPNTSRAWTETTLPLRSLFGNRSIRVKCYMPVFV